jgi:Kef-type K+ transport system membrane component KefB
VLYIALGVALAWNTSHVVETSHADLLVRLSQDWDLVPRLCFVASTQFLFVYVVVRVGRKVLRRLEPGWFHFLSVKSPVAFHLCVMVSVTVLGIYCGVTSFLSAFCAGLISGGLRKTKDVSSSELQRFAFGFFIPLYFGIVGFRIDLVHGFSLSWFLALLTILISVKVASVAIFCKILGMRGRQVWQYAITMSAKGGPGIVVATTALDAGVIHSSLATILIITAVLSSMLVGSVLSAEKQKGHLSEILEM